MAKRKRATDDSKWLEDGIEFSPIKFQGASLHAWCAHCDAFHEAAQKCPEYGWLSKQEERQLKQAKQRWAKTYKKLAWRFGPLTTAQRERIRQRANGHCEDCGKLTPKNQSNVHHVHPRYMGGLNDDDNLVYVCVDCHAKRHRDDGLNKLVIKQKDWDRYNSEE